LAGDIVIVLQLKEKHEIFQRRGDDLVCRHTITLSEALTGYEFTLTHLDKRVLLVKSKEGAITKVC